MGNEGKSVDGKWREWESKVLEEEGMRRRQMTCEREKAKRPRRNQLYSLVKKNVADLHGYCVKVFVMGCISEPRGLDQRVFV